MIFNHDRMLQSYPGADGMKTGYTEASGHNLVTSAVHSGVRLIGVVLGASSNPERDAHMAVLLDQGFEQMDVPPENRTAVASRMPSLVGTAHAATLAAQPIRPAAAIRGTAAVWAIQVGSFASERAAHAAAAGARRLRMAAMRIEPASQRGRTIWRAQVIGLTAARRRVPARRCRGTGRHALSCVRPAAGGRSAPRAAEGAAANDAKLMADCQALGSFKPARSRE